MQKLFESRSEQWPEKSAVEKLREAAVNGMLAAIPGVGPFAAEFFRSFVPAEFDKRKVEWFKMVADSVDEIERRLGSVEAERAVDREEFVTAVFRASRIALSTHRTEKHRLLSNALLNVALARGHGEDEREVLFNAIENFTPAHVRVLAVLRHPNGEMDRAVADRGPRPQRGIANSGTLKGALFFICPELGDNVDLVDAILSDLRARGLARVGGGDDVFPQATWITNFGIALLELVSEPPAGPHPGVDTAAEGKA